MAITGIDTIEGKQIIAAGAVSAKSAEMAYNDENGNPITGYQVAGDYYSASNPSGFITGVDLTPYQLTADMTAYQPVGNYQTAGDYLTTADSANFYTTANESGFITGVPAGTMNESAFGYDANDKISGYNGSAFAGGSDVPEGLMAVSGLEYDNTEISGYSGSAFKDAALTDVVTANSAAWGGSALPISAGPGVKLELVNDTLVASVSSQWIDITNQCTIGSHEGLCYVYSNPISRTCWVAGPWKPSQNGAFITVPSEYTWLTNFEVTNANGKHLDFNPVNSIASIREADATATYWSTVIMWGY